MNLTLSQAELDKLPWKKSSRSNPSGNCVMTAEVPGGVAVRDSKDPSGPVLRFGGPAWGSFVAGIRDGEFDLNI